MVDIKVGDVWLVRERNNSTDALFAALSNSHIPKKPLEKVEIEEVTTKCFRKKGSPAYFEIADYEWVEPIDANP